ncbi:MAG: hypothetical protein ACXIVQ_12185 [Acidimicrobiales bacterium]
MAAKTTSGADRAQLGRLVRKLRADCEYLGADPDVVARLRLEELIECRRRRIKDLMELAPEGDKWDG